MHHSEFYRGLELAQRALQAAGGDDPAARAAAVHRALEPALADTPMATARACHRGCDACCHLPVGVTFPEALALAAAIDARPPLRARLLAAAAAVTHLAWDELAGIPCPLLDAGACAAYAARPLPCRALASADADACAAGRSGLADAPVDDVAFVRGLGGSAALAAATGVAGARELRAAVAAILTAPAGTDAAAFLRSRGPA